jgi:hypothetical protein
VIKYRWEKRHTVRKVKRESTPYGKKGYGRKIAPLTERRDTEWNSASSASYVKKGYGKIASHTERKGNSMVQKERSET